MSSVRKCLDRTMELTQQLITSIDTEYEIVLTKDFEMDSYIKGYHAYKDRWTPNVGEKLCTEREPTNSVDKYAVFVKRDTCNLIVGHLPLGKSGKFAKTVFYFLRSDEYG